MLLPRYTNVQEEETADGSFKSLPPIKEAPMRQGDSSR